MEKKIKVLYDHQAFLRHYSGVSKSFCELIKHLPSDIVAEISVLCSSNEHLIDSRMLPSLKTDCVDITKLREKFPFKGAGFIYKLLSKLRLLKTSENINLDYSVSKLVSQDYDIFHPTFFDCYFEKYISNKPFVLTIHDMMPEIYPQYYSSNDNQILAKKRLVSKAAKIIAISQNTKTDIIRFLGVPEDRIEVVYHGGPQPFKCKEPSIIDSPYFLYVGTRALYKNFGTALDAFELFNHKHKDVKLVCTGPSFTTSEKKIISEKGLTNSVFHKKVTDHELMVLYSHAISFIFPSLYEGFGMPILESYACGCPTILSRSSCFPEIGGDAALYFNPDDGCKGLLEVMNDVYYYTAEQRSDLVHKGFERLNQFSWENSAKKLSFIYRSIIDINEKNSYNNTPSIRR